MSRLNPNYVFGIPRSNLSGIRATLTALNINRQKGKKGLEAGLSRMAVAILKVSQKYCPMDTGELRRSANVFVQQSPGHEEVNTAYIVYTAPYALYVHENTNQAVNWTTPGTGAKFLERAVNESANVLRHVPFDLGFSFQVLHGGGTGFPGEGGAAETASAGELTLPPGQNPGRGR